MDGPVGKRRSERGVDQLVLLDQRQPVEGRRDDRDLEMVAAAGPVLDVDLASGNARSRRSRIRFAAIGNDANDGRSRSPSCSHFRSAPSARSFALAGGRVHETAELLLPRLVRLSRLYEATAKNLLRVSIELVGGVRLRPGQCDEYEPNAKQPRGARRRPAMPSSSARSRRSASHPSGCSRPAQTSPTEPGSISTPSCESSSSRACWRKRRGSGRSTSCSRRSRADRARRPG